MTHALKGREDEEHKERQAVSQDLLVPCEVYTVNELHHAARASPLASLHLGGAKYIQTYLSFH